MKINAKESKFSFSLTEAPLKTEVQAKNDKLVSPRTI